ncbi:MAG TPA: hypothetical protein VHP61_04790 [Acidobacteriota bacterium]|nr:hypothetical protein [Acidobacteriota bacterium]
MVPGRNTAGLISKKDLFFFALFIALFLLVFREFFFTNRLFYERDSTVVEVPVKKLTVQLLKEGNFALWTDAHGNGQPFLANPKNAIFYPTTWLYLFLPLFTAFKLHYLIHALLGWLGLYLLCRSYSLSRRASFLGASLFAFSGMYLSSFEFYNHIAALCWMPWILLLLNREPRPGRTRLVSLSLLWALMILAGAPEFILMTLFLAAGQAFLTAGKWKKKIAIAVLSLLLATILSAVQVLPSLELLGRTERAAQSAQSPLEPIQLFNLPFPHFLGNDREPGHNDFWGWHLFDQKFPLYYSLYMGVGTLLLFLFGLRKPWDRRQKILLLTFFLFFLLACGRYSPFFFLYRFVPLLSSIRYPVKFFLGSVFCLSILAALGFDEVAQARKPGRRAVFSLAVGAVMGLSIFLLFKRPAIGILNKLFIIDKDASFHAFGRSIGTGLFLLVVYALVFFLLHRSKGQGRILGWALIALAVLDPAYHNRYVNPTVPASFYDKPPLPGRLTAPLAIYRDELYPPFLKETMGDNIKLLGFFRKSLYPFTGLGDGVRYVFNWDFYGTYSRRYLDLKEAFKGLPPNGQFKILKYVGCAVRIGYEPLFSRESAQRLQIEGINVWLERIAETGASPFIAFRAAKATAVKDKLGIFTRDEFDPLKEVITEKDILLPGSSGNMETKPAAIVVRKEVQGRGWYSASLPREGLIIFPGNYAPGWHARVDGRRADVFEANIFSKGVVVPSGRHEIVLRYLPASFLWGAAVSLISLGLTLSGLIAFSIRSKRKARRASP